MKAFIINLLVVFVIKVIDNILGTGKTILIQKNKAFIASLTVVISQIIFTYVLSLENLLLIMSASKVPIPLAMAIT